MGGQQQPQQAAAPAGRGSGRGPSSANLYVNNLRTGTTEDQFYSMFAEYGNVVSTKLFSQGFNGYGFVSYDTADAATKAITALNGSDTGNARRPLEVSIKKEGGRGGGGGRFTPY